MSERQPYYSTGGRWAYEGLTPVTDRLLAPASATLVGGSDIEYLGDLVEGRCQARVAKRDNEQCRAHPKSGKNFCVYHDPAVPGGSQSEPSGD